jgi:hypothetical protein
VRRWLESGKVGKWEGSMAVRRWLESGKVGKWEGSVAVRRWLESGKVGKWEGSMAAQQDRLKAEGLRRKGERRDAAYRPRLDDEHSICPCGRVRR